MSYDDYDYDPDFQPIPGKGVPTARLDRECPRCPDGVLVKPRSELPQCPTCRYVENGQYVGHELRDFNLTFRQAKRLLALFGYEWYGTPGDLGTRLRQFCSEKDIDRAELNSVLADLREQDGWGSDR